MAIRTAYDAPKKVMTFTDEESMTKQSFKRECDINHIIAKYEKTGSISHFRASEPFYGNFESVDDYHTALQKINESRAYFEALPAKVRSRFGNDVGAFLEFAINEENLSEMQDLGIIPKIKVEQKAEEVGTT
jgi:phage internal scaffolding protein